MTTAPASLTLEAQADLLRRTRTIAVVGLSPKPHRDSYHVAQYLQQQGFRILPVNPKAGDILGEPSYPSLTAAREDHVIDLVDVFRNSDDVPPVVEEAIGLGIPAIWLQLGIRHDIALQKAVHAGLTVMQDRCLLVEHRRLKALGLL